MTTTMPGFVAEHSLLSSSRSYSIAAGRGQPDPDGRVVAQLGAQQMRWWNPGDYMGCMVDCYVNWGIPSITFCEIWCTILHGPPQATLS